MFIYLGIKGIRNCVKYDHDSVFLVAFIGCKNTQHSRRYSLNDFQDLLVGIGSFSFHSSLKYPMQLVDELNSRFALVEIIRSSNAKRVLILAVIYTACLMNYASWSFGKSRLTRQLLGGGLLSLAIFITVGTLILSHVDYC